MLGSTFRLCFIAGPLILLASGFGRRAREQREVLLIGLGGLVLPMVLTLVAVTFLSAAKHQHGMGNIVVALWHDESTRYVGPQMTLASVTIFGVVRFSASSLVESLPPLPNHKTVRYVLIGLSMCTVAVLSVGILDFWNMDGPMDSLVTALTAFAGVFTADAIIRRRPAPPRRFDWIGTAAFALGFQAPLCLTLLTGWFPDPWWHPFLLPSFAISIIACLLGRAIEKLLRVATTHAYPV